MRNETIDLGLTGYDDLFMSSEERADAKKPKVEEIRLAELTPFANHPFKVKNDEEMANLMRSIADSGVLVPALARPKDGGGYELISGHRRLAACKALGMDTMPVIIRKLTDEEAVITMVDSNLQREHILPSEKAFAYKMKMEARSHQGRREVTDESWNAAACGQVGHKSRDELSDTDSGRQVQRYIRLTHLIPEILQMVDDGHIAFTPAVELSYLSESEQAVLLDAIQMNDCTPSHAQAIRLKALSQEHALTDEQIYSVLSETKPNQKEHIRFRIEDLRRYFPKGVTEKDMQVTIIKLLVGWQRRRETNEKCWEGRE